MKDVILVLNLQRGYFTPSGTSYIGPGCDAVSGRILKLLRRVDRRTHEIILVRNLRSVEDNFFRERTSVNYVGTPDIELLPDFQALADRVVNASLPSALQKSALLSTLKSIDVGKITMVGGETHSSICFTAADLRYLGYDVTVPEPMVVSRDEYLHRIGITLMTMELGINVTSTDS